MSGINKNHIVKEFKGWDKAYPDRFAPGIIPDSTYYTKFHNGSSIDSKITHETTNIEPQEKPIFKKYYHDGTEINWNNLEESNKNYLQSYQRLANQILEKQILKQQAGEIKAQEHDLHVKMEKINKKLKPYFNQF